MALPRYLAPEQIRGEEVDARTDLFALGSIAFELLTGQRAFAGENTVDTLHAILHTPPADLFQQRDDVPGRLATIVLRLLEKAPADRFQSAVDVAWALEQSAFAGAGRRPGPRNRSSGWKDECVALSVDSSRSWHSWRLPSARGERVGLRPSIHNPDALTRFTWALPDGTRLFSAPAVVARWPAHRLGRW